MFVYRLYNKENVYLREVMSSSYVDAEKQLKPIIGDKIFTVEEDGHEVLCGIDFIKTRLDYGVDE